MPGSALKRITTTGKANKEIKKNKYLSGADGDGSGGDGDGGTGGGSWPLRRTATGRDAAEDCWRQERGRQHHQRLHRP